MSGSIWLAMLNWCGVRVRAKVVQRGLLRSGCGVLGFRVRGISVWRGSGVVL